MSSFVQPPRRRLGARRWWRSFRLWERVAMVTVLLGALVISAALVYFQPVGSSRAGSAATPAAGSPTAGPPFPPGTRWYYQRGQWVPQDQQSPIQP